jgi:hypothetical protein
VIPDPNGPTPAVIQEAAEMSLTVCKRQDAVMPLVSVTCREAASTLTVTMSSARKARRPGWRFPAVGPVQILQDLRGGAGPAPEVDRVQHVRDGLPQVGVGGFAATARFRRSQAASETDLELTGP